jgi:uncharacterized protein YecE (DUF72 family)
MGKWWIGCSGFSYKHWRGWFYPEKLPQKKWFEFYCQSFNTVELNVTFYRIPPLDTIKSWVRRSPENFRFTVKAPRLITHYKKLHDVVKEAQDFYHILHKGLGDKLGPVLFQLHPRFEYSEEHLERVLRVVDPSFTNVIEFRHASWWHDHVFKALKQSSITFCSISYPSLPDDVIKTTPVMYYRFHGVPQLYKSSYEAESLNQIVKNIKLSKGIEDVYLYFNNDIDVAAIHNAKTIQQIADARPSIVHTTLKLE